MRIVEHRTAFQLLLTTSAASGPDHVSSSTSYQSSFYIPDSPIHAPITSSSVESLLSSSIAPSPFHSRLKTYTCFTNPSVVSLLPSGLHPPTITRTVSSEQPAFHWPAYT